MKNYTNYLKRLSVLTLAIMTFSCSTEELEQEDQEILKTTTTSSLKPDNSKYDLSVATYYAPLFFQDVDRTGSLCSNQAKSGASDWITRVNFDGDWNAKNNWENMPGLRNDGKNNLYAVIYYNVSVTKSHYYILYSAYHPRDWTDVPLLCQEDSHENDMEGALVVAERKTDGSFGNVIRVVTKYHSTVKKYKNNNISWYMTNHKPKIFIEAKGHGMMSYKDSYNDGTYIEYYPGTNSPLEPHGIWKKQSQGYKLQSAKALWDRRGNGITFASDKKSFIGDNGSGSNKASAPWGWEDGMMGKQPAKYIKDLFNEGNSWDTSYIRWRYMK